MEAEMSCYYCISLLSFFLLILTLSKLFLRKRRQCNNVPPGPPSFPIIGHLHLLKEPLHKRLQQLSHKYGHIFSLKLGYRSVVVISSPSAFEECFTTNDVVFANRPRFLVGKHLNYNFTTVGTAPYGPLWRNLRRITTLEIFSRGRLNMFLNIRQEEVKLLVKDLYQRSSPSSSKVEMKSRFSELSFNIIMRMVTNKRYFGAEVQNNEQAKHFRDIIRELFELSGASNPGDFLPILQWIDFQQIEKKMLKLQESMDEVLQSLIDDCRNKCRESQTELKVAGRDTIIDSMLSMQEEEPEYYTDEIIKGIVLILLMAGTDTSAVTMEWAMSLLLNHPEVLRKARVELDNFVGQDRVVDESDLPKLTYIQAIVNETLRLFPAVPLLSPHESSAECSIGGYYVSSNTMLLVNAWAIHRDPELWDDPTSFKPERFEGLEADTYKLKLIPFGMGRRGCPGAGLANRVVTLALGALIQCFDWDRVSQDLEDMTEGSGLTMPKAKPLEAMCRAREKMTKILKEL
ncbi:cytochrome P450 81Q32-like [Coffea arabica]|uniref:Cytochrome P450 81Q32-like n=1 Tax=Coffea arabica TaxID=13443 RepID=A0ABM4VTN6_COFAR